MEWHVAIRSLQFIAQRKQEYHPIGPSVLLEDMYFDDLLTGAGSFEELHQKVHEVSKILAEAGLSLAKWNASHLIETNTEFHIKPNGDSVTKALGMSWKPQSDVFCFRYVLPLGGEVTKWPVISILDRIYDLLGLLSPVVVGWDETLPSNLNADWHRIELDLQNINNIKVPRFVNSSPQQSGQIHGFSYASEHAYGFCIYLSTRINGKFISRLIFSKSKVAPTKALSLPRLELCGARLLCNVWHIIKHKFTNFTNSTFF